MDYWLPSFISKLTGNTGLRFEVEEIVKRDPFSSKTILWSQNFEKFRLVMNKHLFQENFPDHMDIIDVINEDIDKFKHQKKKIENIISRQFNIGNTQNWIQASNIKKIWILVEVDLKLDYGEANLTLEKNIKSY